VSPTAVLDASAVIAAISPDHVHHARALELFGDDPWLIHAVQAAEVLVHPARQSAERAAEVMAMLVDAGASIEQHLDPVAVATLRAETGLKMPDAIALWTARHHGLPLITFDAKLSAIAANSDPT
jgi:predicted nucleic acid-binding protein